MKKSTMIDNLAKQINTSIIILKNKQSIEFINEEAKKTLKIESKEVDISDLPSEMIEKINNGENIERFEFKLSERIIGMSISTIDEDSNEYSMVVFKDITEIKRK